MGLPERETGGLPARSGRAGGALAAALGRGGAFSSAGGWGSSRTTRLAGATLPLEEIVTLGRVAFSSCTAAAGGAGAAVGFAATASPAGSLVASSGSGRVAETATGSAAGSGSAGAAGSAAAAGSAGAAGAGLSSGCGASGSSTSTTGGGGGLSRPSRSALRLTRSAWASTMLEEWDLTPMLSAKQSSSVSWLVSPSSLASSWTRIFPGKECPLQDSARSAGPGTSPERDSHAPRSLSISPGRTSARKARPKARRRRAASKQAMSAHSQAPRPSPGPIRNPPPAARQTRSICALGRRLRHPMQVRTGLTESGGNPQVRTGLRRGPPALGATRPSQHRLGPGPWPQPRPRR